MLPWTKIQYFVDSDFAK